MPPNEVCSSAEVSLEQTFAPEHCASAQVAQVPLGDLCT